MLVKVAVCKDAFEGEVVKGLLAANDIDCILQNETMSQIYGGIQAFAINVLVQEEDAEKAKELLAARDGEQKKGDNPQREKKSVKRMLMESFLFSFFAIVIMLLGAWTNHNIQPVYYYVIFAVAAFGGWFLSQFLYYRRKQKKEDL